MTGILKRRHRRLARALALGSLLGVYVGLSGCVTSALHEACAEPTHMFGELQQAWLVEGDNGRSYLLARVAGHTDHAIGPGPGPALVWYRIDPDEEQAVVGKIEDLPYTARGWSGRSTDILVRDPILPEGAAPVPLVAEGEPTKGASFVLARERLFHRGRFYALPRTHGHGNAPRVIAEVLLLPFTVAADVALAPVYLVTLGGIAVFSLVYGWC